MAREIIPGGHVEGRFEDHEIGGRETSSEDVAIFQVRDQYLNQTSESREETEREDWKIILKVEWQDSMND